MGGEDVEYRGAEIEVEIEFEGFGERGGWGAYEFEEGRFGDVDEDVGDKGEFCVSDRLDGGFEEILDGRTLCEPVLVRFHTMGVYAQRV